MIVAETYRFSRFRQYEGPFLHKSIGSVIGSYVAGTAIGGFTGRIIIGALTDLLDRHAAFMVQGIVCLLGSLFNPKLGPIYITGLIPDIAFCCRGHDSCNLFHARGVNRVTPEGYQP